VTYIKSFKKKPSEESGGCVIETKTNDCPSVDGKESLCPATNA